MIFSVCMDCAHLLLTSRTLSLSLTDRWLASVTPSIRTEVARRISGNSGGRHGCSLRLLSVKMTSTVLARLRFKLLAWTHSATCSSLSALDWTLQAGITTWMSSAYLWTRFIGVAVVRSAALMTKDTGPIADPCTMLAEMFSRVEVEPPYARISCSDCVLRNTPQASCRLHQECPGRQSNLQNNVAWGTLSNTCC